MSISHKIANISSPVYLSPMQSMYHLNKWFAGSTPLKNLISLSNCLGYRFFYLQRITIADIKKHPWFLKNLPRELTETAQAAYFRKENPTFSLQSVEEIMKIVEEAKTPAPVSRSIGAFGWGREEDAEAKEEDAVEEIEEDEEDEYDKTVKQVHASGEVRVS